MREYQGKIPFEYASISLSTVSEPPMARSPLLSDSSGSGSGMFSVRYTISILFPDPYSEF